jgi:hypothetical protein
MYLLIVTFVKSDIKWKREDIMNTLRNREKNHVSDSKLSLYIKSNISFKDHIKNKETIKIMKKRLEKSL